MLKKNNFMRALICGSLALVLDPSYLAADEGNVQVSYEEMPSDNTGACLSYSVVKNYLHKQYRRGRRGHRGPIGAAGATGATGPTGAAGSLAASYTSFYSSETQNIPPSTSSFLAFSTLQTSNGTITPSASGSAPMGTVDTFTVTNSGIYLITWNVAITTGNNVAATLDLLIDGAAINSPFESLGYGGGGGGAITEAVSGSFLVNLNASQTIQLQVSSFVGDITANSPSISLLKIADLPAG